MGDNKEERKKMKKTRYVALVLLSSLLTLVGCSRREILDDYPVTGINIRLDWEGVTAVCRKESGLFSIPRIPKEERLILICRQKAEK